MEKIILQNVKICTKGIYWYIYNNFEMNNKINTNSINLIKQNFNNNLIKNKKEKYNIEYNRKRNNNIRIILILI